MVSPKKIKPLTSRDIFEELKKDISILDSVSFAENYLTIDGKPFDLSGSGWKYMAEIYRTVSAQVDNKEARPMILLKGRQVGATIMAGVISLHLGSSGLYGTEANKPPIRVMHVFPDLKRCGVYAKDILANLISGAKDNYIGKRALKVAKVVDLEDTQTQKNFIGMSKIRVDSIGKSGDRIRGSTQDVLLLDECLVGKTCIETDSGKETIKNLYKLWKEKKQLPMVKTFNEQNCVFEYKKILNAWERDPQEIWQVTLGNREVRATANHRFLTTKGWRRLDQLQLGDYIMCSPGTEQFISQLNDDQMQIALGSFMGDGGLTSHKSGRCRLKVIHGIKQREYCEWKASMFGAKTKYIEKNGFSQKPAVVFVTRSFGLGHLPKSKSTCPQWVLDSLDARGLAIWFMDDGSVANKINAVISTCSFDEESNNRIVKRLAEMGIEAFHKKYKKKGSQKEYSSIYLNKKGYFALSEIIAPFIHDNISYKIPQQFRQAQKYIWNRTPHRHSLTVVDSIKKLENKEKVYDIEVEDNHNFVATSGKNSINNGGPILHNCQDMNRTAIENTLKVLTATPYGAPTKGVQVFFGTPKHAGSYFWTLWEDSDQRFYQLRCKHCDHYFHLYNLENDDWNDTWIKEQLIKCPSCLKTQDKREAVDLGRWIATKPINAKGEPQKYIGYHFNMMLSPLFTKENVLDYWPQHNKNASERAWKNETKGQFYSASEVPLTMEDIYANSLDDTRGVAKSITNPAGKSFFLGMDWGEKVESDSDLEMKRGKSFTCAVILSVDHTGVLTVENAVRLKKNDPDYKMNVVRKLMSDFKIDQAAADFYYGNDFVRLVQHNEGLKDKFVGCTNLSNSKRMFSYDEKDLMVGVNKDQTLDEIFGLFKRGRIKLPAKGDSLELLSWLIEHITSMETHTKTKDGIVLKTYKKGVIQNDGLMALMYAYTAYKFMVTRKFTENAPDGVNKKRTDDVVIPIVGYIPRMH